MEGQAERVPCWKTGEETEGLGGHFTKKTADNLLRAHNNHWGQGGLNIDQALASGGLNIGQAIASGGLNSGQSLASGGLNSGQAFAIIQSSSKVGAVASIEGSGITWASSEQPSRWGNHTQPKHGGQSPGVSGSQEQLGTSLGVTEPVATK